MVKKILIFTFFILSTVAFSQQKAIKSVRVSPNPFSQKTVFYFNLTNKEDITITVKNVLGKTVFNKSYTVSSGNKEIPFYKNNLKPGMYIYAIQTRNQVISKRFVIK